MIRRKRPLFENNDFRYSPHVIEDTLEKFLDKYEWLMKDSGFKTIKKVVDYTSHYIAYAKFESLFEEDIVTAIVKLDTFDKDETTIHVTAIYGDQEIYDDDDVDISEWPAVLAENAFGTTQDCIANVVDEYRRTLGLDCSDVADNMKKLFKEH